MATAVAGRNSRYQSPRSAYGRGPGSAAYDGSAARVLDREEVLRPRPQVRTRERAIARPKVQVREAGHVSLFAVAGFLAVGVFAVLVLLSSVKLTSLSDDVVSLNSRLTSLQSEEAKLRAKYELAFDVADIEQSMTSNGTMVKPQNSQIIYLDLSEPDSVVLFQNRETPVAGAAGALESVKSIFGNIVEYFR